MKKISILPNIITAFGLACGLFVIFKMNMLEPGMGYYKVVKGAISILFLAAFADLIDGALARLLKAESDFGLIFDSLADAISFGIAPAVLILKTLSWPPGTWNSFIISSAAMIYVFCGILRLARFNAQQLRNKDDLLAIAEQKKNFTGLPIPAASAAVLSLNLLFLSPIVAYLPYKLEQVTIIMSFAMIITGYLMVSRLKFLSLKMLRLKVPSFNFVFFSVCFSALFFYGLHHYFSAVFTLFAWGYVLLALILSCIRKIAGRKSKTLEDFEPDPEDFSDDEYSSDASE